VEITFCPLVGAAERELLLLELATEAELELIDEEALITL